MAQEECTLVRPASTLEIDDAKPEKNKEKKKNNKGEGGGICRQKFFMSTYQTATLACASMTFKGERRPASQQTVGFFVGLALRGKKSDLCRIQKRPTHGGWV
jgi:hypothetical protein